ncbi:MAG: ferritin-like domain-containing protein [Myxococcota bacterium]
MHFRPRLTAFLATFLAPLSACEDFPVLPKPLDDVACLYEPVGGTCPDDEEAASRLVGSRTCEAQVREVVDTGALVSEQEVTLTPYGSGGYTLTGDTGIAATPDLECCYEAAYRTHRNESCVIGRPVTVDGEMVSAHPAARSDWADGPAPRTHDLSAEARAALARLWSETGLLEHASVPAFAQLVLDLTALGAPGDLVARATSAMADEVRHAAACFALASAYAGRPVGPGALALPPTGPASLVRLAVETFREGCVGETCAVAVAAAQRQRASDPAVRAVLDQIVEDEADHAALGWDIVRWALAVGGPEVRAALWAEVDALTAPVPDGLRGPEGAQAHGLATPEILARAVRGVMDNVVRPEAEALFA